jgi:hypothetical protein
MARTDFDEMTFTQRINYLWTCGDFILHRWQDNNLIGLFTLDGFYVEVFYKGRTKHIDRIESIKEDTVITTYLSGLDLSPLFALL